MSATTLSLIVRCWHNEQTSLTQVQVVRVDTEQELQLPTNTFLLRVTSDAQGQIERFYIRHHSSGREAYVQGGPGFRDFVRECLVYQEES